MHIRFIITAIKADGLRHMAFNNNHHNTFISPEDANSHLQSVLNNNNEETLKHIGSKLKVEPTICFNHGDSIATVLYDADNATFEEFTEAVKSAIERLGELSAVQSQYFVIKYESQLQIWFKEQLHPVMVADAILFKG